MNEYEQLIDYIINEQEDKARELFHTIVVEKSRDIYESLIDEADFDEAIGGNQVDHLVDEVEADEHGMQEAEADMDSDADMIDDTEEMGGDHDLEAGDDMGGEHDMEMGGEGGVEEKIQDLESALEELKAEFDALMAGEEHEEEMEPGIHGGALDHDEAGEESDLDMEESVEGNLVREYVEKVSQPNQKAEGSEVGDKGQSVSINKKSTVAGKNPLGDAGTTENIARGGSESAPDGKPTPTPNNQYTKGRGDLKGAGSFENVPGAHTKGYTKKATSYEKQHGKEGQTTDGKLPVDDKAVIGGKVR